jgi:hypothetical protein
VFITATFVSPEDREFALKIGVARIIPKPLNLKMFLDTVEELLAGRARVPAEAFDEFQYYDGYRRLMEGKLEQKTRQIARDERLLWNRIQYGCRPAGLPAACRPRQGRDRESALGDTKTAGTGGRKDAAG